MEIFAFDNVNSHDRTQSNIKLTFPALEQPNEETANFENN